MSDISTTQTGTLSFIIDRVVNFEFAVELRFGVSKIKLGTYPTLPIRSRAYVHEIGILEVTLDPYSVNAIVNNILKSIEYHGLEIIIKDGYLVDAITKIHQNPFNLNVQVLVIQIPQKEIDELDEKIIKDISNTFTINNVTEINTKELVDQNKTIIELLENILNELKKKNEYDRIKNTRPSYRF